MPFKMMHAFETVYNKDTLPCLCLAKSKDRERTKRIGAMEYNVSSSCPPRPPRPTAPHSTTQASRPRAHVSRVSRRVRDPNAYRIYNK